MWKIIIGLLRFICSPVVVFWEKRDKILHFYIWAILMFLGAWFWNGGLAGLILITLAILKEEIWDGMLKKGVRDMMDIHWSFRGVVWSGFLYLAIQHIIRG